MISFHPTLSPFALLKYVCRSFTPPDPVVCLQKLFPENKVLLTDSGSSAFAITIEALNLRGKTLILPAYICDALYPVLQAYDIHPLFLDVDRHTYQPPLSAYTDELLEKADAVLLVATYGRDTDTTIVSHLKEHHISIIEDYAAAHPFHDERIAGDARMYSLPKTLPVPDGGLAVISKNANSKALISHKLSLSFAKNILKLLPMVAPTIALLRHKMKKAQTKPSWTEARQASDITQTIFVDFCNKHQSILPNSTYTYCEPLQLRDPEKGMNILFKNGINAERIWQEPIIMNTDVQNAYSIESSTFPETVRIASKIVCVPLWHITEASSYARYEKKLKEILTECF